MGVAVRVRLALGLLVAACLYAVGLGLLGRGMAAGDRGIVAGGLVALTLGWSGLAYCVTALAVR